jgi:uncharacterized membrane protein YfcA
MIPCFLLLGLESVVVLGTNKVSAVMGSFTSALSFRRSGKVDLSLMRRFFPLSFGGSAAGVYAVHLVPAVFLRPLVVVMLTVVTIYSLSKKQWGQKTVYRGLSGRRVPLSIAAVTALGFYDGFFGPGTGSFLLFCFLCLGFDFVGAAANARILNFASNMAAAVAFVWLGQVNYYYALPVGAAMILGALAGTRLAVKKGAAYVRPLFVLVTSLLIGKQIWDLFQ